MTFEEAFNNLTLLVEEIEDDEIQLDSLAENVKKANELILFCETKLRTIKEETGKLRSGATNKDS
jgi:exodeoxyribonuclease VII small subunit